MNVQIPHEQLAIIEELVATGRFASTEEAIAAGISLLASSEQLRKEVQKGVEQADRTELVDHDTVFSQLRAMAASQANSQG